MSVHTLCMAPARTVLFRSVRSGRPDRRPGVISMQRDNLRAEVRLQQLVEDHPEVRVTILRCCPALGAHTSIDLLREMYLPGWLGLSDYNPPLQFVSDDDLARNLVHLDRAAAFRHLQCGPADGVVFLREFARELSEKRFQMPSTIAYPIKRLTGGAFVAYKHYLDRWPVIMSTAKLRQAHRLQIPSHRPRGPFFPGELQRRIPGAPSRASGGPLRYSGPACEEE